MVSVRLSCMAVVVTWTTRSGKPSPLTSSIDARNVPLGLWATPAPANRTVAGSTVRASKVALLRMATGMFPRAARLITAGTPPPGLISMPTIMTGSARYTPIVPFVSIAVKAT